MNKLLLAVWLTLATGVVYAACTSNTISQGGRMIFCTTCCDAYGNCNTFCN